MESLRGCSWGCQQSLGRVVGLAWLAAPWLMRLFAGVCPGFYSQGHPELSLSAGISPASCLPLTLSREPKCSLCHHFCALGDSLTCSLDPFCFVLGSGTSHVASFACLPLSRSVRPGEPSGWRGTSRSHAFSQALGCIPSHLNLSSTFGVIIMITYR